MPLRIDIVTDINKDQARLLDAWQAFSPVSLYPAFELKAMNEWWKMFGPINNTRLGFNKKPFILLIYRDQEIVGILPLMKVERFKKKYIKFTTLEFFSQSGTGDYLDIIHHDLKAAEIAEIFEYLYKHIRFDLLNLCFIPESSVLLQNSPGKVFLHAGKVIIPLEQSYEQIRQQVYSKNLRHVLNKFNRRIKESNKPIVSKVLEGRKAISQIKNEIKNVSLSKLKDQGMHSMYENEEMGERYFDTLTNGDHTFCSIFKEDDQLLSYNMGYVAANTVYALDAAYNRIYADTQKIGLGILAYDQLVQHYAGNQQELDMGFGLDDYKFRFSKKIRFTKALLGKGNTLKSGIIYRLSLSNFDKNEHYLKSILNKYNNVE